MIRSWRFFGVLWKLRTTKGLRKPVMAECDYDTKTIRIPLEGNEKHELDWIVHESLHALFPHLREDWIDTSATDLAGLLWKLGWRKEE